MNKSIKQVQKGEIYYAELSGTVGSEQGGIRPVLIIQNDVGNRNSPTTIIAPLTTKLGKAVLPTHIIIGKTCGLLEKSIVLLEQIRTVDKCRLRDYVGTVESETMKEVDACIEVSFGIGGDSR